MRNASEQDLGDGNWNVYAMYQVEHPWHGILLAHIKEQVQFNYKNMLAMETADGCPIIAEYEWLRAVQKRVGTPAKPKKAHQRGTKPWLSKFEYVDYDPKLITPGVRVKCRDKKIKTVAKVKSSPLVNGSTIVFDDMSSVWMFNGKMHKIDIPFKNDIMKILVEKKIDKPAHDRYNGYEVGKWNFWRGFTDVPPVDGDVKVEIWVRRHTHPQPKIIPASACDWNTEEGLPSDIIAFRIVEDK